MPTTRPLSSIAVAADVESPGVPRGLPKALTEDEVTRLIDAVVGDTPAARRDRAILEVLYGCGLRISELMMENEKAWRSEAEVRAGLWEIWQAMQACVQAGLAAEGVLPAGLSLIHI